MANQISRNVPDQAHAAQQTAAHLRTFWTPAMIAALADEVRTDTSDVRPEVTAALALVREPD